MVNIKPTGVFQLGHMEFPMSVPVVGHTIPGVLQNTRIIGIANNLDYTEAVSHAKTQTENPVQGFKDEHKLDKLLRLLKGQRPGMSMNDRLTPSHAEPPSRPEPQINPNYQRVREDLAWRSQTQQQR